MPCRGGAHYLGEIEALRFEIHAGPQMLRNAVLLLTLAGRWSGILVDQNAKLPAGLTGLARRLEEVAVELEHIPKEVDDTVKLSSAALAQEAVELVLASHWACDPDFSPFLTLDDSPPPNKEAAHAAVWEAVDVIVGQFEGTASPFTFASPSDDEEDEGESKDAKA